MRVARGNTPLPEIEVLAGRPMCVRGAAGGRTSAEAACGLAVAAVASVVVGVVVDAVADDDLISDSSTTSSFSGILTMDSVSTASVTTAVIRPMSA